MAFGIIPIVGVTFCFTNIAMNKSIITDALAATSAFIDEVHESLLQIFFFLPGYLWRLQRNTANV